MSAEINVTNVKLMVDDPAMKVMVNDVCEMLGFPANPKYDGWYWAWDQTAQKQGLFNEKGEQVRCSKRPGGTVWEGVEDN